MVMLKYVHTPCIILDLQRCPGTRNPFVFPSLGPTAYLFFFSPQAESASPRNAVLGDLIGLLCGFAAYRITGMHPFPQGFGGEVYWPRILASALALALTGAIIVLLHVNHPPAGATTMIVSLGILAKPEYLAIIESPWCCLPLRRSSSTGLLDAVSNLAQSPTAYLRSPMQKENDITEAEIASLVDRFYAKVREDDARNRSL
jgi:HPP family